MGYTTDELIGKGLTFPLKVENGKLVTATGVELLRSSIAMLLSWPKRTKFYDPNFGCRIRQIIADPSDNFLKQMATYMVLEALDQEKRISLLGIDFSVPNDQVLLLKLRYKIISTDEEDTFTFPFYKP